MFLSENGPILRSYSPLSKGWPKNNRSINQSISRSNKPNQTKPNQTKPNQPTKHYSQRLALKFCMSFNEHKLGFF